MFIQNFMTIRIYDTDVYNWIKCDMHKILKTEPCQTFLWAQRKLHHIKGLLLTVFSSMVTLPKRLIYVSYWNFPCLLGTTDSWGSLHVFSCSSKLHFLSQYNDKVTSIIHSTLYQYLQHTTFTCVMPTLSHNFTYKIRVMTFINVIND